MIGEILTTLNIIEKAKKFFDWILRTQKPRPENVSGRFIQLFESHDVHRNQIPRFFGHGLSVKDVQDEALLIDKLDENLLDAACALFAVRREWLECADSQVYPCHDFYKHPEEVAPFLKALQEKNPEGGLDGILIAPTEGWGNALIILSEVIGSIGEKPIYRYHLCNNWLFEYWKSRAYMTAFVAIAWKHKVYIRGGQLPSKDIEKIACGEALLDAYEGCPRRSDKLWYPEDMALEPEAFLSGIDPERKDFGLKSAVELWLRLDQDGYMDTGLPMYSKTSIRDSFERMLET